MEEEKNLLVLGSTGIPLQAGPKGTHHCAKLESLMMVDIYQAVDSTSPTHSLFQSLAFSPSLGLSRINPPLSSLAISSL